MQNSILQEAWNLHISAVIISLIASIIRKTAEERIQNSLWPSYFAVIY